MMWIVLFVIVPLCALLVGVFIKKSIKLTKNENIKTIVKKMN